MNIKHNKATYLTITIAAHLVLVAQVIFLGWWPAVVGAFAGLVLYNVCAYLYMHRILAHSHFNISGWSHQVFCTLYSTLNLGSIAVSAGAHINHHRFSDTAEDPHNFRHIGLIRFLLKLWGPHYKPHRKTFARAIKNPAVRRQHNDHLLISVATAILAPAVTVTSFWVSNLIFGVTHLGLPDKNGDRSKNVWWLWPLTWGEEWHKDHHYSPGKKKLHSLDILYYIGKLVSKPKLKNK